MLFDIEKEGPQICRVQSHKVFKGWTRHFDFKVARGGRGSGKSHAVAQELVTQALELDSGDIVLCCREIQKSIAASSFALIKNKINYLGLSNYYNITKRSIATKSGVDFVFEGLGTNVDSVKSMEGIKIVWLEEGHTVSHESLDVLFPTVRADGAQIWVTYNPTNDDDAIHEKIESLEFGVPGVDFLLVDVNWDKNPWFPENLNRQRKRMKKINMDLYRHIWLGHTLKNIEGAIIKRAYFPTYSELPTLKNVLIIADTALQAKEESDYTVFLLAGVGLDNKVYLMDLVRGKWEGPDRLKNARSFWALHKLKMGYGIGAREFKVEKAASGFDMVQTLSAEMPITYIQRSRGNNASVLKGHPAKFKRLMDNLIYIAEENVLVPDGPIMYDKHTVTDGLWVPDFLDECQEFTADDSHDHDDQVDTLLDAIMQLSANSKQSLLARLMGN